MVGSIANRAITDLIREGNVEGLRNFLESRKSHVDDKDEVMPTENITSMNYRASLFSMELYCGIRRSWRISDLAFSHSECTTTASR